MFFEALPYRVNWYVIWCVVENFYFWYCVGSFIGFHESNDALAEVTNLDADILQEGADCLSSHDYDYFRVHFGQIGFHDKT